MTATITPKGWCPTARRPMATGDGLLVRLHPPGGRLTPEAAHRLAGLAETFGNGLLDLTQRGNLQLRGVGAASLPKLQARLADLGLLEAEGAVHRVICSPLADLDPTEAADAAPLADALETALARHSDLLALPAKFFILVDGGGSLPLDDLEPDIRLTPCEEHEFHLAAHDLGLGAVGTPHAVPAVLALCRAFLKLRLDGERRMRDVVRRVGGEGLWQALPSAFRQGHVPPAMRGGREGNPREDRAPSLARAGFSPFSAANGAFAAAAPFGRLTADQLSGLASLAQTHGWQMRLSFQRAVLLAPVPAGDASMIACAVKGLGLIADPHHPLLCVSACAGSPGCAAGEADVRRDAPLFAEALAPLLGENAHLHVSGCAKGCAWPRPAAITLVAAQGRYALAFHADAGARRVTPPLSVTAMAEHLSALDGSSLRFPIHEARDA